MVVKDVPEGLHLGAIVAITRSIERVVEVGQRAPPLVVGEVPPQPAPLGGAPLTPPDLLAVAVESHDVPGPSIVRVVASGGLPRTPSEVIEVGLRPGGGVVLVVASRRLRAVFVPAPGGIVAVAELRAGALGVDVVAEGEDGSRYSAQRPCCFAVSLEVASGDVSRADQRHCPRLADARHCRQHVHRACQHHHRGYRSASKNDLAHPLHPPLCGVEDKSEIPPPLYVRDYYEGMQGLQQLPRMLLARGWVNHTPTGATLVRLPGGHQTADPREQHKNQQTPDLKRQRRLVNPSWSGSVQEPERCPHDDERQREGTKRPSQPTGGAAHPSDPSPQFSCPYCHKTTTRSAMKVLLAYGPAPRDKTRHKLAVALVWNAEAFPELAFFEGELEGE